MNRDREIHHEIQRFGAQLNLIERLVHAARREHEPASRASYFDAIENVVRAAREEHQALAEEAAAQRRRSHFEVVKGGLLGALGIGFWGAVSRQIRDHTVTSATTAGLVTAAAAGVFIVGDGPRSTPVTVQPSPTAVVTAQAPVHPDSAGSATSPKPTPSLGQTTSPSPSAAPSASPSALPSISPPAASPRDAFQEAAPDQPVQGPGNGNEPPPRPVEEQPQRERPQPDIPQPDIGNDGGAGQRGGGNGQHGQKPRPGSGHGNGHDKGEPLLCVDLAPLLDVDTCLP